MCISKYLQNIVFMATIIVSGCKSTNRINSNLAESAVGAERASQIRLPNNLVESMNRVNCSESKAEIVAVLKRFPQYIGEDDDSREAILKAIFQEDDARNILISISDRVMNGGGASSYLNELTSTLHDKMPDYCRFYQSSHNSIPYYDIDESSLVSVSLPNQIEIELQKVLTLPDDKNAEIKGSDFGRFSDVMTRYIDFVGETPAERRSILHQILRTSGLESNDITEIISEISFSGSMSNYLFKAYDSLYSTRPSVLHDIYSYYYYSLKNSRKLSVIKSPASPFIPGAIPAEMKNVSSQILDTAQQRAHDAGENGYLFKGDTIKPMEDILMKNKEFLGSTPEERRWIMESILLNEPMIVGKIDFSGSESNYLFDLWDTLDRAGVLDLYFKFFSR